MGCALGQSYFSSIPKKSLIYVYIDIYIQSSARDGAFEGKSESIKTKGTGKINFLIINYCRLLCWSCSCDPFNFSPMQETLTA